MKRKIFVVCFFAIFFILKNLSAQEFNIRAPSSKTEDLWQKSIEDLKQNLTLLLSENQELRQKITILEDNINELNEQLQSKTQENQSADILQQQLSESKEKINKLETIVKQYSEENFQLVNKLRNTEEQTPKENLCAPIEAQVNALSQEKLSLEQRLAEQTRQNAISESLLKAKPRESPVIPVKKVKPEVNPEVLGYNLAKEGKLREAVEEYKKAIINDPKNKDLYFNLGYIYFRLKDFNKAVVNYKKTLELDPQDKEALFNLSKAYEGLNDSKNSKRYYDAYLELRDR